LDGQGDLGRVAAALGTGGSATRRRAAASSPEQIGISRLGLYFERG